MAILLGRFYEPHSTGETGAYTSRPFTHLVGGGAAPGVVSWHRSHRRAGQLGLVKVVESGEQWAEAGKGSAGAGGRPCRWQAKPTGDQRICRTANWEDSSGGWWSRLDAELGLFLILWKWDKRNWVVLSKQLPWMCGSEVPGLRLRHWGAAGADKALRQEFSDKCCRKVRRDEGEKMPWGSGDWGSCVVGDGLVPLKM